MKLFVAKLHIRKTENVRSFFSRFSFRKKEKKKKYLLYTIALLYKVRYLAFPSGEMAATQLGAPILHGLERNLVTVEVAVAVAVAAACERIARKCTLSIPCFIARIAISPFSSSVGL